MDIKEASERYVEEWYKNNDMDMKDYPIDVQVSKRDFIAGARWMMSQLPKWKRYANVTCWSGEIGCKPTGRKYTYENYAINADKLFILLEKEERV